LTCADPRTSVPLYFTELPNNNDFYTTSITAVTTRVSTQGYVFQGVVAHVFVAQELSTVPLFHLTRIVDFALAVDDLYTVSTADRDSVVASGFYKFVDIAGYIYPSQICGSGPFYRLWQAGAVRHFYTTWRRGTRCWPLARGQTKGLRVMFWRTTGGVPRAEESREECRRGLCARHIVLAIVRIHDSVKSNTFMRST
jgi:hypothetical protein